MPTMDADTLHAEADGLPALRAVLRLDELGPGPGELRPDMQRPGTRHPSPVSEPGKSVTA